MSRHHNLLRRTGAALETADRKRKLLSLRGRLITATAGIRSSFWFRPTLASMLAFAVALLVLSFGIPFNPLSSFPVPDQEGVERLFELTASSSLTVVTVALSVLMVVLNMAGSQASPRAVPELMADSTVQNALAGLVAVFVFSVTALLGAGFAEFDHDRRGALVLAGIATTILLLYWIVRLITHATDLLKLGRIIERTHRMARQALDDFFAQDDLAEADPRLPATVTPTFAAGEPVWAARAGFVLDVEIGALVTCARDEGLYIHDVLQPGEFATALRPLLRVSGSLEGTREATCERLRGAFAIGSERMGDRDVALGLELLGEIAAKALSPGINDPETAIICLEHAGDLLALAGGREVEAWPAVSYLGGRVRVHRPSFEFLLTAGLEPIARHGSGDLAVCGRLLEILGRLAAASCPEHLPAILAMAQRSAELARHGLATEFERSRIDELEALVKGTELTRAAPAAHSA
jgi:uncharacterized membrane protein